MDFASLCNLAIPRKVSSYSAKEQDTHTKKPPQTHKKEKPPFVYRSLLEQDM